MYEVEDELIELLQGEDDLGVVIRSHIYIESLLNKFIDMTTTHPKYIDAIKMEFSNKILLCLGLGLDEELKKPLGVINSIRNSFAHTTKSSINKNDVNNIYKEFTGSHKDIVQSTYAKISKETGRKEKYKDLEPKEQFILHILSLRGAILSTIIGIE